MPSQTGEKYPILRPHKYWSYFQLGNKSLLFIHEVDALKPECGLYNCVFKSL
jgi:hypothetical protein